MNRRVESRQLCALSFSAFTVPAIMLLPRLGWLWAGAVSLASAGLIALLLHFGSGEAALRSAVGRPLGKAVLAALLLWNVFALGSTARLLCQSYPNGTTLIGLLLLLLAAYAASKGRKVVLRTGALVFLFLAVLYVVLIGFSLSDLRVRWLAPQKTADWRLFSAALLPTCGVWLTETENGRMAAGWLIGGVALAVLAALVTAGGLSPQVAAQESFPFYAAAKSVSIFGALERLEPIVSAAVTAGGFCALGLLCCLNEKLLGILTAKKEKTSGAQLVNFFGGSGGVWLSGVLPTAVTAVGSTIFWGLVPLGLLLLENWEKFKKTQKNA